MAKVNHDDDTSVDSIALPQNLITCLHSLPSKPIHTPTQLHVHHHHHHHRYQSYSNNKATSYLYLCTTWHLRGIFYRISSAFPIVILIACRAKKRKITLFRRSLRLQVKSLILDRMGSHFKNQFDDITDAMSYAMSILLYFYFFTT